MIFIFDVVFFFRGSDSSASTVVFSLPTVTKVNIFGTSNCTSHFSGPQIIDLLIPLSCQHLTSRHRERPNTGVVGSCLTVTFEEKNHYPVNSRVYLGFPASTGNYNDFRRWLRFRVMIPANRARRNFKRLCKSRVTHLTTQRPRSAVPTLRIWLSN